MALTVGPSIAPEPTPAGVDPNQVNSAYADELARLAQVNPEMAKALATRMGGGSSPADWLNPVAVPDALTGGAIGRGAASAAEGLGLPGFAGDVAKNGISLPGIGGTDRYEQQVALAQQQTGLSTGNAQQIYNAALAEAARAGGFAGAAPIQAATIQGPDLLNRADYLNTAPTQAESVDATGRMQRAGVTEVAPVAPATVAAVNTGVAVPQIGPAEQAGRTQVGLVNQDPIANALREQEIRAAKNIAGGPSAAMSQFQAGENQAVRDALSMAARARGSERAGARREAIIAATQSGAGAALSAAALAAQEEQAKRVASASALSGIRGQDVTLANTMASIRAEQANLQAQLDQAIATGNRDAANAIRTRQAELQTQANTASVQAGLAQQGTMAGLAQANLGVEATRAQTNAAAQNLSAANYAAALNAAAESAAGRQTTTNLANVQTGQAQAESNLQRALTVGQTNVANQQATRTANAANQQAASTANATNQLSAEQLRQSGTTGAQTTAIGATGVQSRNAQTVVDANKAASAQDAQQTAALIGAAGTAGAALLSDERAKMDVARVGGGDWADRGDWAEALPNERAKREAQNMDSSQIGDWADHVAQMPIVYRYKPGYEDGGAEPHIGLPARELEGSGPIGEIMVQRRPDGMRQVDYGAATLMLSKAALERANEALAASKKGGR